LSVSRITTEFVDESRDALDKVMKELYIHIKKVGVQTFWSGAPVCAVGHRILKPGDQVDDGVFAGWSWDGAVLCAWNDRYGIRHLYSLRLGEEIALSTSILRLLAEGASTELNYSGLSVFLRLGAFLAEDTPFRDIRALPPTATLEWTHDVLSAAGGIRHAKPQRLTRNAALDAYILL